MPSRQYIKSLVIGEKDVVEMFESLAAFMNWELDDLKKLAAAKTPTERFTWSRRRVGRYGLEIATPELGSLSIAIYQVTTANGSRLYVPIGSGHWDSYEAAYWAMRSARDAVNLYRGQEGR